MEAEVPILLVNFNYALKQVGFLKLFYPTGNIEKDFKEMESYFNEAMQP
jgi:hypothetical protein